MAQKSNLIKRTEEYGKVEYRVNESLHRPDGPARIWDETGNCAWWLFGDWHRYYGPHTSWGNYWYIHGAKVK